MENVNKYVLDRYHKRRMEAIQILGIVCATCKSSEDLQFDHIDPKTKKFDIGKNWSINAKEFWEEIDKCQLLCISCHKIKSANERSVEHGGGQSGKRNCPCQLCKDKKAAYMKLYKKSNLIRWS